MGSLHILRNISFGALQSPFTKRIPFIMKSLVKYGDFLHFGSGPCLPVENNA